MNRSTWQRHERRIARAVDGQRAGNTGQAGADIITDRWSIECKAWRNLPARVLAALRQAERTAQHGRVAIAVLHETGQRHDADLVVLRWKDFSDLLIGNHVDDQRVAARVGALIDLAHDADEQTRRILAPDGT